MCYVYLIVGQTVLWHRSESLAFHQTFHVEQLLPCSNLFARKPFVLDDSLRNAVVIFRVSPMLIH